MDLGLNFPYFVGERNLFEKFNWNHFYEKIE